MDILERTFKLMDVDNTGFITDDQLLLALHAKGASGETIRGTRLLT
jgi:Ca2+-binding EF-hand superfamily protein